MNDIDECEITNAERASRFQAALVIYNDEWDVLSNLIDLLADARHWCDREVACYADLDRLAHRHYLSELESGWRAKP